MEQENEKDGGAITKTNSFGDNPTGDALAEGLICLFKPTIDLLDERISATRESQLELKEKIDTLAEELKKISDLHKCPLDLELYVKKLAGAKRKVSVVSSVLQNTQASSGRRPEDTQLLHEDASSIGGRKLLKNRLTLRKPKKMVSLTRHYERLSKVQVQVAREAQRRRALLEPSPAMSPVAVESNVSLQ